MRTRILANLVLGAALAFGAAPAARAQATHLGVFPKQMVKINYLGFWDGTTFTAQWSDYQFGVLTGDGTKSFVVPKGKTLILTDIEVTIRCQTAVTAAPSIQLGAYIADPAGNAVSILNRFIPTRQTVGHEMQRTPMTAGYAIPEGYQIVVDPIDPANGIPSHYFRRVNLLGYYIE
ncbi:MAG: hypothetical protein IPQ13_02305 [Holophagaceae bacterium]|nr:hypothetical protein [Holophagaceae bacterium]